MADEFVLVISDRMRTAITFLKGPETAARWLNELPQRVNEACQRWDLTPQSVAEDGAMSCCVYATGEDGRAVVFKIPHEAESGRTESIALARWAASGAGPELLACDEQSGELLMERILPGTVAWPGTGPEASKSLADLLLRLHAGKEDRLASVGDLVDVVEMRLSWANERFRETGNADGLELVGAARSEAHVLLEHGGDDGFLHGDLQPKNILVGAGGRWFAIDPFACYGDRHADVAFWAVMQTSQTAVGRRISELAASTGMDEERLRRWACVFAIAELRPYLPESASRMVEFLCSGAGIGELSGDAVGRLAVVAGLHGADAAPGNKGLSATAQN